MTTVAIHQPTFLPWLGWWDKLVRADVLVLLDDVQFPKKGGSWMNRVRVLVAGEPRWITVPVDRAYHGVRSVREMRIDDSKPWRGQIGATLARAYAEAAHRDDVLPGLEDALAIPTDRVAELNEATIRKIAEQLELDTAKLVRQSDLGVDGTGTDLLISLCRAVDADAYLTGDGADGYLDADRFAEVGLDLVFQEFVPPDYPQLAADHAPGLSIVDALMSCGWSGTRALLAR
jgi:WbqC-like protein family